MFSQRMLTPEASPEPEPRASGLWQPKATTTTTTATPSQKRKRSWPFTTTRPVSPPSSSLGTDLLSSSTSVKALWENGWKSAARKALPPFQDADYDDIEPIFDSLIDSGIDDATSPEYTLAFYPKAHDLALRAENALLHHSDTALAAALYLRACALLRVARYSPPPTSPHSSPSHSACPARSRAWQLQKSYHAKAGRLWADSPLDEVTIPHTHDAATQPDPSSSAAASAGVRDRGDSASRAAVRASRPQIPLAVRLPPRTLATGAPCPAVVVATDDRTAHAALCGALLARGWGCVVVEAPGCGDCPVPSPRSGAEAEALWASVLEWMWAIRVFDMRRVVVWAAGVDGAAGLAGLLVGGVGGARRVRGCVAVAGAGPSVLSVAGGASGRVLVVSDDHDAGVELSIEADGLWTPVVGDEHRDDDDDDEGLVLFEYGTLGMGSEAVRLAAANATAVYDWVEDLLSLDMAV
ncbi:pigment biosynthesis protein ayg1 [Diaporthe amygdali]|uniref:pigment biosynthesis protein ayg1 n=1 Tax=Phomopsis amygdali TaxID=1214568 RepID=UPI0022FEBC37|nr:pigment biosynthesis protein ayg1 [Diaporthe amygdali]KAJ0123709.1 pigment biosynthesis protein ayg1 [Diaporthe amygdali]